MAKKTTKRSTKKTTKKTAKKTTKKSPAKKPVTKKKTSKKVVKKAAKKTTKKVNKVTKKTTTSRSTAANKATAPKKISKPVKSKYNKKAIKFFYELLMNKRRVLLGDIDSMSREAMAESSDLSHMPLHMADVGSNVYAQEQTLGHLEKDGKLLGEIEAALERIEKGTYGMCEHSGIQIPEARLKAKPWARYTIEVARDKEGGRRLRSRRRVNKG